MRSWAGKSSPARQQLESTVIRRQIEAVLTPQQLKTINDNTFPETVVGLLYDAKTRQKINFTSEQAVRFRGVAKEKLARSQEMSLEQAEKLWATRRPNSKPLFEKS